MRKLIALGAVVSILAITGGCGMTERKVDPAKMQRTTQTTSKNGDVVVNFAPGEYGQKIQLDVYATCMAKVEADKQRKHDLQVLAIKQGTPEIAWAITTESIVANITHENGLTMRNIWGKGEQGICQPGTNMWDAVIAEANAVAATQQTFITTTGDVVKGVLPDYFRFKIFETFAENSSDTTTTSINGDSNQVDIEQKDEKIDINAGTTGDDSPVNLDVDNSKVEGSSGSSGSATDVDSGISGFIQESEANGLTTGETAVKLTEQGYSPTISGGEIYVDGTNYGGW